jgi:hypothetical protein
LEGWVKACARNGFDGKMLVGGLTASAITDAHGAMARGARPRSVFQLLLHALVNRLSVAKFEPCVTELDACLVGLGVNVWTFWVLVVKLLDNILHRHSGHVIVLAKVHIVKVCTRKGIPFGVLAAPLCGILATPILTLGFLFSLFFFFFFVTVSTRLILEACKVLIRVKVQVHGNCVTV